MRAFESDEVLTEAFGEELSATVADVRRGEIALFDGASPDAVCRAVRWKH